MEKMWKKKLISLFLAAIMLIVGLPAVGLTFEASAYGTRYGETGLCYEIQNGEAVIVGADDLFPPVSCNIPASINGYPVTSIGSRAFCSRAFYYCDSLDSITIPDSVKIIGDEAFSGCTGLKSVTIGNGVTDIGDYAFGDCTSLKSVTIGSSVTDIGDYAFRDCSGLTNVTIPESVTDIGDYAFLGCKGLTSITIPESVTSIGSSTFGGCSGLKNITIPDSVTSIGSSAFSGCSGLTSVTIPDGVTSIGRYAFGNCNSLTSVTIPDSVENIGKYALGYNYDADYGDEPSSRIADLTIYGHIETAAEEYARRNGFKFVDFDVLTEGYYTYKIENGEVTIVGCDESISADVTIPDILGGYPVKSIGKYAFQNCTGLTSITIPNCMTDIGYSAFRGCTSLKSVTLPESITYIGNSTFSGCSALESIEVGNNVRRIGKSVFENCTSLENVTIGNGVKTIGKSAFNGCASIVKITIPNSVTSVGESAFAGCTSLKSVTFGNGIDSISQEMFRGCTSLSDISIPDSVTSIGYSAFRGCSGLTDVTIPNSVTSVGSSAFLGCKGLTSVTIPDSVTSIDSSAFRDCSGLKNITIPSSVTSIGNYAFLGCKGLTSVTIPESVTSIGDYAFGYKYNNDNDYGYDDIYDDVVLMRGKFTIYGYVGTAAEEYADENLLKFVALEDKHVHTFSDWTVTTPATCTAEGVEKRTCTVCGEEETRKTEKTDHSLTHIEEKSTCTVAGVSYDICGECSATFNYTVLPLSAHSFSAWATTKEPTDSEAGEETRTCTVCGFEEKREIKQLEPGDGKNDETKFSISKLLYKIELFLKKLFDLIKSVGVA